MTPQQIEDLLKNAALYGWWLYCESLDLWMSPSEMRRHLKDDRPTGGQYWITRNPEDRIKELQQKVKSAQEEVDKFMARMKLSQIKNGR